MTACQNKDYEMVKYLIENGADPNITAENSGTPLINAFPDLELVKYLVKHGADINQPDRYGTTPIIIACKNGYIEVVKYLLNQKVNADIYYKMDKSPLYSAQKIINMKL